MTENFKVKVNSTLDFEIQDHDLSKLDTLKISKTKYHILQEHESYKAEITKANFNNKSYQVKINNNIYNVDISNALDLLIKDMGFKVGRAKQVDFIKAPMPGLILEITIKVGQEVKENDPLLVLEAMKMENSITSPRDGIIKSISAQKGDAVEKNQLLIEFN
jgi:biotin carboxyl carrier protein